MGFISIIITGVVNSLAQKSPKDLCTEITDQNTFSNYTLQLFSVMNDVCQGQLFL